MSHATYCSKFATGYKFPGKMEKVVDAPPPFSQPPNPRVCTALILN